MRAFRNPNLVRGQAGACRFLRPNSEGGGASSRLPAACRETTSRFLFA